MASRCLPDSSTRAGTLPTSSPWAPREWPPLAAGGNRAVSRETVQARAVSRETVRLNKVVAANLLESLGHTSARAMGVSSTVAFSRDPELIFIPDGTADPAVVPSSSVPSPAASWNQELPRRRRPDSRGDGSARSIKRTQPRLGSNATLRSARDSIAVASARSLPTADTPHIRTTASAVEIGLCVDTSPVMCGSVEMESTRDVPPPTGDPRDREHFRRHERRARRNAAADAGPRGTGMVPPTRENSRHRNGAATRQNASHRHGAGDTAPRAQGNGAAHPRELESPEGVADLAELASPERCRQRGRTHELEPRERVRRHCTTSQENRAADTRPRALGTVRPTGRTRATRTAASTRELRSQRRSRRREPVRSAGRCGPSCLNFHAAFLRFF
ncbi:hypothetical protein QFZ29_003579 [Agromyces albus]|nr:hypothetical protein [Agromyces albus]